MIKNIGFKKLKEEFLWVTDNYFHFKINAEALKEIIEKKIKDADIEIVFEKVSWFKKKFLNYSEEYKLKIKFKDRADEAYFLFLASSSELNCFLNVLA